MKARIVILGLIYLLMLGSAFAIEKANVLNHDWQSLFTEPIEIVYIIMKDGKAFNRTNHDEIKINMDAGRLEKALKKRGYEIEGIAVIIHNHLRSCRFSSEDYKRYRRLKKYGFDGLFLVYCHTSKKTYDIEDKNK